MNDAEASEAGRAGDQPASAAAPARRGPLLGPMRIRKKLIVLHTTFSLALAAILLLSVRPAVRDIVARAEADQCRVAVRLLALEPSLAAAPPTESMSLFAGAEPAEHINAAAAARARANPGEIVMTTAPDGAPCAVLWDANSASYFAAAAQSAEARRAILRLYVLVVAAIVGVYVLIALTLEAFVLPRQVYRPVRLLLSADQAVQSGDRDAELIPDRSIPADELGEIMRSRNESILKLRSQEAALNDALDRLEVVATDLKRKNHLLETARRNMADQDRLASLGVMSAGIAHELNTPLAVIKGCVEELAENPRAGVDPDRAALMLRVVRRLERLSESLLDFARVRPPTLGKVRLGAVIDEAWTLVRLDREASGVELSVNLAGGETVTGDDDRLTQVFVNLLRNAVDALGGPGARRERRITVSSERSLREGREWLSVTIQDTGPGIDPALLPRLFEPFNSSRLDAKGTGLGLAVSEGIVREHGGLLLARNGPAGGAVFEIMLPLESTGETPSAAAPAGISSPAPTSSSPEARA